MPRTVEGRLWLAVVLYFGTQLVLRLLIGPSLELDEAEAFYHARSLAWGYGPQPPLYFWLQWGMFQVFGETLFALALLKALILAAIPLGLFGLLRRGPGDLGAAVGALSLGLLPSVVWEAQRALTHSPLALLMAVATAWAAARALESGRWRDHAALGVAVGLGVLSKFNYVLWPAGLLLAVALLPEWRARLRLLRVLGAMGLAILVVAPVAAWMLANPELATESVGKLALEAPEPVGGRVTGTVDLLGSTLSFVALPALVLVGFARVARRSPVGEALPDRLRLIGAAAAMALLVLWLGVLVAGVTELRERWLLPFAWPFVPVAVLWLWPRLGARGQRGLAGATAGLWLLAMVLLPYASLVSPGYRGADFGPLVERLRASGAGDKPLGVEPLWVAGNLALQVPDLAPRLLRSRGLPDDAMVLVLEGGAGVADDVATSPDPVRGEPVSIRRGSREVKVFVVDPGR